MDIILLGLQHSQSINDCKVIDTDAAKDHPISSQQTGSANACVRKSDKNSKKKSKKVRKQQLFSLYYFLCIFYRAPSSSTIVITGLFWISVRSHFTEFLCYLYTLDIDFKIIGLSETSIIDTDINDNIPNYNC